MFAWALNAFSSPFFLGAWLSRLRDRSLSLWQALRSHVRDSLPSVGSCIQVLALSPLLFDLHSSRGHVWLCHVLNLTHWLDLGPASWLWMGLAATGLLTDSSYHQQSKPSLWCADQTSWLDFRLYHHSLDWWAGLGWSILVPASTAAPITAVRLHHQGNSCWPSCSDSTCLPWWSRAWLCSSLETFKNTLLEITRSSSCLWPD